MDNCVEFHRSAKWDAGKRDAGPVSHHDYGEQWNWNSSAAELYADSESRLVGTGDHQWDLDHVYSWSDGLIPGGGDGVADTQV